MAYLDEDGVRELWNKVDGEFARKHSAISQLDVTGTGGLKYTMADGQEGVLTEFESMVTSVWFEYDSPSAGFVTINFGHYGGNVDSISVPYRLA